MNKFKKQVLSILLVMALAIPTVFFYYSPKNSIVSAATENKVSITLTTTNSWTSNGDTYSQIDGYITNNGTTTVKDWSVLIPVLQETTVNQGWCMNYALQNDNLIITPLTSNTTIAVGDKVTFGIVLINAGTIRSTDAILTVDNSTSSDDGTELVIPNPTTDDWLYTDGSKILDKNGKEVWMTGLNWFGYNTGTNIFDGVWSCDLISAIKSIADRGFNLMRVPFSAELILDWKSGTYPTPCYNDYINDYLVGMNSLEIWDYVVDLCRANGIKIMIDIHSAETNAAGHMAPLWYTSDITEADYLASLSWIAERYANDDTIIAYDLKNEPHGGAWDTVRAIWNDSTDPNNWKYVAEKAAFAVLNENPNALVMVEGIQIYPKDITKDYDFSSMDKDAYYNNWWGGNLRGVKDFPINLGNYQNKLVYSPHDYGPTVSDQPWFYEGYTGETLYEDCWRDNWMFIQEENIAPLLIGEWGGFMTEPNITWMTYLRDFIIDNRINHTFWCYNANSGDTGGLVLSDFTTWDEEKYSFVKRALWQKEGKFVGLDQEIPLGSNGISLNEY